MSISALGKGVEDGIKQKLHLTSDHTELVELGVSWELVRHGFEYVLFWLLNKLRVDGLNIYPGIFDEHEYQDYIVLCSLSDLKLLATDSEIRIFQLCGALFDIKNNIVMYRSNYIGVNCVNVYSIFETFRKNNLERDYKKCSLYKEDVPAYITAIAVVNREMEEYGFTERFLGKFYNIKNEKYIVVLYANMFSVIGSHSLAEDLWHCGCALLGSETVIGDHDICIVLP